MGTKTIGAVGGLKIPSVDIWIAGYRKCAQMAVPGTKVLIGYSQDFVATDKCKTVAENQIAQGAQVLFQVAGRLRPRRRSRRPTRPTGGASASTSTSTTSASAS